ncbi:rap guanine nucleotide exchange factor 4 isoform X3 [Macrobrachium rosenbergii]|uniref:rap guanine nucleotide exchange factor 4 isoform X3 n=1 Tax=Macrobrachium rosenbergii TaxID=79674 RepID=UPI0034D70189
MWLHRGIYHVNPKPRRSSSPWNCFEFLSSKPGGVVGEMGAGSTFGESVLNDAPRKSTIITRENCELLRVEQKDFRYIWQRNKELMQDMLYTSSRKETTGSVLDEGRTLWRNFGSRRRRSATPRELPKEPTGREEHRRASATASPTRAASSSPVRAPGSHHSRGLASAAAPQNSHTLPKGFTMSRNSGAPDATPPLPTKSNHSPGESSTELATKSKTGSPTPPQSSSRNSTPRETPRSTPTRSSPVGNRETPPRRPSLSRAASFDSPSVSPRRSSLRSAVLRLRCESQDTAEEEDEDDDDDDEPPSHTSPMVINYRGDSQENDEDDEDEDDDDYEDDEDGRQRRRSSGRIINGEGGGGGEGGEGGGSGDGGGGGGGGGKGRSGGRKKGSRRKKKTDVEQQRSQDLDSPSNAAVPIVDAPSVRICETAWVLRSMLLARAPHLMKDRKQHGRQQPRCVVGTELTDWLLALSSTVHSRSQAAAMWQCLLEEGALYHVAGEQPFRDKYLFYRFLEDSAAAPGTPPVLPTAAEKREAEDRLTSILAFLQQRAPDAMLRLILRKPSHERTIEDQELIFEELQHLKALAHLSNSVKRELASVIKFESHSREGTVLFQQGTEGKSWYIILKGSVNVAIHGKGVVHTLHEGDDFGKLALVNDAPRAATIVLHEDNCHFLRVDKSDFNRILRDVEANTVRLKEHGQDVLVLEKISSNAHTHSHYKYTVMAGTPQKTLEHLLETRLDGRRGSVGGDLPEDAIRRCDVASPDSFLDDFFLTHIVFMPYTQLTQDLLKHYRIDSQSNSQDDEFIVACKRRVILFVHRWVMTIRAPVFNNPTASQFLQTLQEEVARDVEVFGAALREGASLMLDVAEAIERHERDNSSIGVSKWKLPTSGRPISLFGVSSTEDSVEPHRMIQAQDDSKGSTSSNSMQSGDVSVSHPLMCSFVIFRVYCADHTYCTLRFSLQTTCDIIKRSAADKLGLRQENLLLVELKSSGEVVPLGEKEVCAPTGLTLNGRLFVSHKDHLDALTPLPEQEGPAEGTLNQLEMYSTKELAYHITTHDWDLFSVIHEYEFLYQVFGRDHFGQVMCNLDVFLRRFNEIQYWVVSEICLAGALSKRTQLLRKFIKLAAYCKEHQNLNAFFAIVIGLSNVAVSRLTQTWERLSSRFRKMYTEFEMLIDPSRNHRAYRIYYAKLQPPILPFTPLLMKDMTFTHEGNKTKLDGLVNFEKMHMLAETLRTIRYCRSRPLALELPLVPKNENEIRVYVRNLQVIDNQRRLLALSQRHEPKRP